ncbi:MAG: hypothetical protein K6F05_04725 [Succinivibrio sp.]|nr:hypothetical protein [Succinivibrio sp.]
MFNSALQPDASQQRAKRRRYDLINLVVISSVVCCYVAGFLFYQSYLHQQRELMIDPSLSSAFDKRSRFTRNIYKAIIHNKYQLEEGVVAYDNSSFSLELGDCTVISGFSNRDQQKIVTASFVSDWKNHLAMPKAVSEALTVFLQACENTFDEQLIEDLRLKMQIRDQIATHNVHLLVISETTRYELTFVGHNDYQLVVWASPRGSLRSFNFDS